VAALWTGNLDSFFLAHGEMGFNPFYPTTGKILSIKKPKCRKARTVPAMASSVHGIRLRLISSVFTDSLLGDEARIENLRPTVLAADGARRGETRIDVNVEKQPRCHVGFRPIQNQVVIPIFNLRALQ
jgi:hypothetical protein